MDSKVPLSTANFTIDVAPLPSAPPPSYDDAMASASNIYPSPIPQQTTPLISENLQQAAPLPQNPGNAPYPVQQIQITPAAMAASPNRQLPVGRQPLKTTCPGCSHFISTKTRVKNRCTPTFWCIVLFCTVLCIPCSCCPYFCCDSPMKVEHFCPRCNAFLGTYVDHSWDYVSFSISYEPWAKTQDRSNNFLGLRTLICNILLCVIFISEFILYGDWRVYAIHWSNLNVYVKGIAKATLPSYV